MVACIERWDDTRAHGGVVGFGLRDVNYAGLAFGNG